MHDYSFTTDEDMVLLDIIQFLDDVGIPDHIDPVSYTHLTLPTTPYV